MRPFKHLSMPRLLICCLLLGLWGCASWPGGEPLQVNLAGIDALPSEGMEVRMAVKLRVRNPNDTPVDFDGVSLNLELRGQDFASGVSDTRGSVPRFGETVLTVPVTVSAMAIVRQAFSFASGDHPKLDFVARGKLAGSGFGGVRFESKGEFDLPAAAMGRSAPARN
jgi:Late embryogenesis abundant protein